MTDTETAPVKTEEETETVEIPTTEPETESVEPAPEPATPEEAKVQREAACMTAMEQVLQEFGCRILPGWMEPELVGKLGNKLQLTSTFRVEAVM